MPLTFRRSGSLPLQVSLELPDAGGERRKAKWNKGKTRTTQKQRRVCVNVKGVMSRLLSTQGGGGTAGSVVGGVSGLRKCALVSDGKSR